MGYTSVIPKKKFHFSKVAKTKALIKLIQKI